MNIFLGGVGAYLLSDDDDAEYLGGLPQLARLWLLKARWQHEHDSETTRGLFIDIWLKHLGFTDWEFETLRLNTYGFVGLQQAGTTKTEGGFQLCEHNTNMWGMMAQW